MSLRITKPVTPSPPNISTVDRNVALFETPSPEDVIISINDLLPDIDCAFVVIIPDESDPAEGKLNV